MLKSDEREIDGLKVRTQQLMVFRSARLLTRLGKHLTPALAKLGGADLSTAMSDIGVLGPALEALFENLDGDEVTALIRESLPSTRVESEGKLVTLDSQDAIERVFAGRVRTLFKVVAFALEVNFADFFADSGETAKTESKENGST